jgi:hypothetical protein
MPDYIYCGSKRHAKAGKTQALLVGEFNAIWYPPMARVSPPPVAGERVWLVWRADDQAGPLLLAGGRIRADREGNVLWTNRTLPRVRQEALALGYTGPLNMAFLRLSNVVPADKQPVENLGIIRMGLRLATDEQIRVLSPLLPIP